MSLTRVGVAASGAALFSCLILPSKVRESGSIKYVIFTSFMSPKLPTCEPPRPWRPATPIRIASLEPSTFPEDLVPARVTVAAAASVLFRKLRRVDRDMGGSFQVVRLPQR